MALLDDVKVALRVTTDALDPEISLWVDAALADMRRIGVPEPMLDESDMDPLVRGAVILFVKGRFGYDNDEAERFDESYQQIVKDILNSPTRYGADEEDDGE